MTGNDVVAEARTQLGVRWQHQACLKDIAHDCIGLVGYIGLAMGFQSAIDWKNDQRYKGYGPEPGKRLLLEGCTEYFVPVVIPAIGDVVIMRFEHQPMHFAIVSAVAPMSVIHSLRGIGVVEHRVDRLWKSRIYRAFRFRELA